MATQYISPTSTARNYKNYVLPDLRVGSIAEPVWGQDDERIDLVGGLLQPESVVLCDDGVLAHYVSLLSYLLFLIDTTLLASNGITEEHKNRTGSEFLCGESPLFTGGELPLEIMCYG